MCGGTAFREGPCEEWGRLGLFFLFLLSGSLGKANNPLPHTFIPPHPCTHIPEPHYLPTLSPPLAIVICACFLQGLTMNQMKKLLERKVSLLRYLPAYPQPLPLEWVPGGGPVQESAGVGRGFPVEAEPWAVPI